MSDPTELKILGPRRENETFDVARTRFVDYLSHGSQFVNCTINIHGSARGIVFHGGTFTGCEFHAKRRFTSFSWHDVSLSRCRFFGEFDNCRFGPRPTVFPAAPRGSIEDCDFSAAQLGWCEFFQCRIETIRLPGWPTFTIHSPVENSAAWMKIGFPTSYADVEQRMIGGLVPDYDVTGLVAVTQNANDIAKRHGVTPEAIRGLIEDYSFISL